MIIQARGWRTPFAPFPGRDGVWSKVVDRCNCAINDPFERKEDREDNPRQLAIELIIKQYPDHPQTLTLLRERAENDPDEKVREFANKKLAELEK